MRLFSEIEGKPEKRVEIEAVERENLSTVAIVATFRLTIVR